MTARHDLIRDFEEMPRIIAEQADEIARLTAALAAAEREKAGLFGLLDGQRLALATARVDALEEAFGCCLQIVRSMNATDDALPREPLLRCIEHFRDASLKAGSVLSARPGAPDARESLPSSGEPMEEV